MTIDQILDKLDWKEVWDTIQIGETVSVIDSDNWGDKMGREGALRIGFRPGNYDAYVNITGLKTAQFLKKNLVFRNESGGGDENIYKALCILAVTMKRSYYCIKTEETDV